MWKFSAILALAAAGLAAGPPPQNPSVYDQPGTGSMFDHTDAPAEVDRSSLAQRVDEALPLYDALARETRRLDKAAKDALIASLKADYGLDGQAGPVRQALEKSESVLDLGDAIHNQAALVRGLGPDDPQGEAQAKKLQDMQSGLASLGDDLRRQLGDQQKDLNEKDRQQLTDWLMISEGLLRHRREAAEAAALAHPAAEAPPLSAAAVSPTAQPVSAPAGSKP
ncbi:MAG TPA: hypothetical protein VNZ67_07435 [bacterium]|jgi:hypothetical protein|nr:hypothetical protein [bacterium]